MLLDVIIGPILLGLLQKFLFVHNARIAETLRDVTDAEAFGNRELDARRLARDELLQHIARLHARMELVHARLDLVIKAIDLGDEPEFRMARNNAVLLELRADFA